MRFALRKWYLDCVAPSGDAAVVYVGRLSLGPLSAPYFELMASPALRPLTRMRRVSGKAGVNTAGHCLELDAAPLGVTGRWTPQHPPIEIRLLDDARGRIVWRCHQPSGLATLRAPDGSVLDGLGYAEELTSTVAPWSVPFDELRWGRFVSERKSVVWIDWRGGLDRRWVFVNGASVEASAVEADRIVWPGAAVVIPPGRVLREGRVGQTVAGTLAAFLPRRLSHATETKWISPATFRDDRGGTDAGWVIHELVRWG